MLDLQKSPEHFFNPTNLLTKIAREPFSHATFLHWNATPEDGLLLSSWVFGVKISILTNVGVFSRRKPMFIVWRIHLNTYFTGRHFVSSDSYGAAVVILVPKRNTQCFSELLSSKTIVLLNVTAHQRHCCVTPCWMFAKVPRGHNGLDFGFSCQVEHTLSTGLLKTHQAVSGGGGRATEFPADAIKKKTDKPRKARFVWYFLAK